MKHYKKILVLFGSFFLVMFIFSSFLFSCRKDKNKNSNSSPTSIPIAGCIDSAYGYRDLTAIDTVWIPKAFTPNGDGINDEYRVIVESVISNFSLTIKDYTGATLFNTTNPDSGWNGKNKSGAIVEGYYIASISFTDSKANSIWYNNVIASYQYHGGCIPKDCQNCDFDDQIDTKLGFVYPTHEMICP